MHENDILVLKNCRLYSMIIIALYCIISGADIKFSEGWPNPVGISEAEGAPRSYI